jgi:lipopolysaccharide transport system ATP-binding protein
MPVKVQGGTNADPLRVPNKPRARTGAPVLVSLQDIGVCFPRKRRRLGKRQDWFWALREVSFDVRTGDSVGVVGRNGSGKTTLLKVLAGIIRPDTGRVVDSGVHASLLSPQVGFASHLTGRENILLSGMLLGMSRHEIHRKMDSIVSFAELDEFIDQPIKVYSSGMRARLGFAIAFEVDPDIVLIDEALGVGDAAFREKASRVLRHRVRSEKTFVIVSHSASAIRELCNHAIWIEKGTVRTEGPPDEVLQRYQQFLAESPQRG